MGEECSDVVRDVHEGESVVCNEGVWWKVNLV